MAGGDGGVLQCYYRHNSLSGIGIVCDRMCRVCRGIRMGRGFGFRVLFGVGVCVSGNAGGVQVSAGSGNVVSQ